MDPAGEQRDHLPPRLQDVLRDEDLGDGLGRRHGGSFVCSCPGTSRHLRDVQDDVGGTDVGDGVLFYITVSQRHEDGLVIRGGRGCRGQINNRWR